jgi:hypothetical protein
LPIASSQLIAVPDSGATFPHLPSGCRHGLDALVLSMVVVEPAASSGRATSVPARMGVRPERSPRQEVTLADLRLDTHEGLVDPEQLKPKLIL